MNKFLCLALAVALLAGFGRPAFATHSESLPILGADSNGQPVLKLDYDTTDSKSYIQCHQIWSRTSSGTIGFADADGDEADVTINVSGTLNLDGTLSFDSGGTAEIESGSTFNQKAGSTWTLKGTTVTSDGSELNFLDEAEGGIETGIALSEDTAGNFAGSAAITFANAKTDAAYIVVASLDAAGGEVYYSANTTTGCTLNVTNCPTSGNVSVSWVVHPN